MNAPRASRLGPAVGGILAATALSLLGAGVAHADEIGAVAQDSAIDLNAKRAAAQESGWLSAKASGVPAARLVEYARAEMCDVSSQFLTSTLDGACDPGDGAITPPDCGPGIAPLLPLWSRTRTTADAP
ncbi:hypothetical protein, partial [Cellulomonas cellasea]|uniref:hypothetical protein n=1 Tax=Cellulomonas cellasea TaxID=43670 RepID=UPI001C3FDD8C